MNLREEYHRGKVSLSSHLIKSTYCEHDLGLLMLNLDHLTALVFVNISTAKLLFDSFPHFAVTVKGSHDELPTLKE